MPGDIDLLKSEYGLSEEDAMKRSVLDFLADEMNVPERICQSLTIRRVFPPSKDPNNWSTLYAEFQDPFTVELLNQYVRHLKPGKSLSLYVPHSLYPRFSAICDIAHSYRNGETKFKTKIKYGPSDFSLLVKPRNGTGPWTHVSLNDLPPLSLSSFESDVPAATPSRRERLNSKRLRSPEQAENCENRINKQRISSPPTSQIPVDDAEKQTISEIVTNEPAGQSTASTQTSHDSNSSSSTESVISSLN